MSIINRVLPHHDECLIPIWSHNGEIICSQFVKEDGSPTDEAYPFIATCFEIFEGNSPFPELGSADKCISNTIPFVCTKEGEAPVILYWSPIDLIKSITNIAVKDIDQNTYRIYTGDNETYYSAYLDVYKDGWIIQIDVDFYKDYSNVLKEGSTLILKLRILRCTDDPNDKFGDDFTTGYMYCYEKPKDIFNFINDLRETVMRPEYLVNVHKD